MMTNNQPANNTVSGSKEATQFRQWQSNIKQLLWEADYAMKNGQWNKAQELLFQVKRITHDHDSNITSRY
jgi:hypothetical protein